MWSGEGSVVHKELISNLAKSQGKFVNDDSGWSFVIPASNLALHVGLLSMKVWEQKDEQRPDQLRALYVRPSDAEMNANVDR